MPLIVDFGNCSIRALRFHKGKRDAGTQTSFTSCPLLKKKPFHTLGKLFVYAKQRMIFTKLLSWRKTTAESIATLIKNKTIYPVSDCVKKWLDWHVNRTSIGISR